MITRLSKTVRGKIEALFSPSERSTAADLLSQYGVAEHETEVERVRLDILLLCRSDLAKLRTLVELAKTDYRDVIAAAEYPNQ